MFGHLINSARKLKPVSTHNNRFPYDYIITIVNTFMTAGRKGLSTKHAGEIAVAMPYTIENTRKIVDEVKNALQDIRIIVIGTAFIGYPELRNAIDASYAHNGEAAVPLAQRCWEEIRT